MELPDCCDTQSPAASFSFTSSQCPSSTSFPGMGSGYRSARRGAHSLLGLPDGCQMGWAAPPVGQGNNVLKTSHRRARSCMTLNGQRILALFFKATCKNKRQILNRSQQLYLCKSLNHQAFC